MNSRRLFIASCMALVASAFSFVIRQDILQALRQTFNLSQAQSGLIGSAAFFGMAFTMLVGAPLCDSFGMKRMLALAWISHLVGTILTIAAPWIASEQSAYPILLASTFLVGGANGLVEIGINPLAATLYPTKKTHMLNMLHAWWPGGLMLGGLIAFAITKTLGLDVETISREAMIRGWQIKMCLILIPTVLYGLMFVVQKLPVTERVASGISNADMFREALRPMFLLWAFCMLLTAATELGPQSWQESVLRRTAGISGTLILVYTSSLMFIFRHFAGAIAHKLSPVGMLVGSSILSAIGLFSLSYAFNFLTAFLSATIFGLGIVFFWPTMLGVTAERFPKGGAFLLGIMGCVGNLAVAANSYVIGGIYDNYTLQNLDPSVRAIVVTGSKIDEDKLNALPKDERAKVDSAIEDARDKGARMPFRYVSILPTCLVLIFSAIVLYDRSRGGYKPEEIRAEAALASDY
jgi:fucose permease